jgi:hypothetical protein
METRGIERVEEKSVRELNLDLTNKPFSEQLRIIRCVDGLSQQALCLKMGFRVTDAYILSAIENGRLVKVPERFIEPLEQYLYEREQKGGE